MVWVLASVLAAGITGDLRVAVTALFCFGVYLWRSRPPKCEIVFLLIFGIVLSIYGHASISVLRRDARRLMCLSRDDGTVLQLEGYVSSFPHYGYGGMRFEFKTELDGVPATLLVRTKEYLVAYGDSLRISGRTRGRKERVGTGFSNYLLGRGLCGEFQVNAGEMVIVDGVGGWWVNREVFWPAHDRIRREMSRGLGGRSGLPIALLLGEKGYLERKTRETFVDLGISHLLALSGLHLGFVTGALMLALRLIRRRSGVLLVLALAVYVCIVGPILSLLRAFVMAVVLIIASSVKRPLDPVTALGNAFVLILMINPHALYGVGFQLSFLATFGVLLCVKTLRRSVSNHRAGRIWDTVRSSLQVSLAAQAFVAPVILHYFGRMSVVSPLATLVFVFPVALLLLYAGVSVVGAISVPAAGCMLMGLLDRFVRLFHGALLLAARTAPDTLSTAPPDPCIYYSALALMMFSGGRTWPKILGLSGMGVAFGVSSVVESLF